MVIDAWFQDVVVYNVFYNLDVKVGQKFTLVMDKPEEMDDVFVNRDKVLAHDHNGTHISIEALSVGQSKVRIMLQDTKVREILVNVKDSIGFPAETLNASFGQAVTK